MIPNPNDLHPNPNLPIICYIKNAVDNSSAKTGEFQYLEFDRKDKVYKLDPPVRKLLSKSEAFAVIKVLLESRGFNQNEMKTLIDKLIECCIF